MERKKILSFISYIIQSLELDFLTDWIKQSSMILDENIIYIANK